MISLENTMTQQQDTYNGVGVLSGIEVNVILFMQFNGCTLGVTLSSG